MQRGRASKRRSKASYVEKPHSLTKKLRMVEEKVAPRKVEEKVAPRNIEGKRCQRGPVGKGERKSLEPFPDAQLAMQIPSD